MNISSFVVLAAMVVSQPTAADELPLALVHAKSSPLKVSRVVRENDLFAEFKGTIWVTGSLIVEWYGNDKSEPEYLLVPDRESKKRLPHFARYSVRWIGITNGEEAFQRAGGNIVAVRGNSGDAKFSKITGSFEISNYVVGVECDSPWARAVIVRSDIPNQSLVAGLNSPERC